MGKSAFYRRSVQIGVMFGLSLLTVACASTSTPPAEPRSTPSTSAESNPSVGLQVGQRAPTFTVKGLDDKPLTSADLLAQDKPFILFFFATW